MKYQYKRGFIPFGIVLLIVLGTGVIWEGYSLYKKQQQQTQPGTQIQNQTNTKTQTLTPPSGTSSWKTYIGTGYTIKYPPDWYTRTLNDPAGAVISSYVELSQPVPDIRAKTEINKYDNPKKLSPKEWYGDWTSDRQDPDTTTEDQPITIDGAQAYVRVDHSLSSEGTVIYIVYLQRNNKMYHFWAGGNKKFEQTLLQILSSFKFTK